MNKRLRKLLGYSLAVFFSFCCVCSVLSLAVYSSDSTISTPTPALRLPEVNLSTVIAQTYSAAQIQTQALFTPTPEPLFTLTFTPTVTMLPTATLSELKIQTAQAWATYYANPTPTITPFIYPTDDGIIIEPPSGDEVCPCSGDMLNCGDFSTQNSAQACMDYCIAQGAGDIHNLDGGGVKGLACENLP